MRKGVLCVSLFIWEKEGTPWHDVTRCTPVHRIPNPNIFVFFSTRGTREQACRAVRGTGAKCTARCFRPETQARFAQHGVGCEYYGHLRSESLENIGRARPASPLEGKKKGGLFFFRRSPRARARNFWSSACEPHSTVNDRPTTCQGGPIFTLVLTNCNFPYISTFQKHVFSVPSARHLDNICNSCHRYRNTATKHLKWPEPSKPQESLPVVKHQENN